MPPKNKKNKLQYDPSYFNENKNSHIIKNRLGTLIILNRCLIICKVKLFVNLTLRLILQQMERNSKCWKQMVFCADLYFNNVTVTRGDCIACI